MWNIPPYYLFSWCVYPSRVRQPLEKLGLAQWPNGNITPPTLGFEATTFRSQPQHPNPLSPLILVKVTIINMYWRLHRIILYNFQWVPFPTKLERLQGDFARASSKQQAHDGHVNWGHSLGIVQLVLFSEAARLHQVVTDAAWLDGVNEVHDSKTGADLSVLQVHKKAKRSQALIRSSRLYTNHSHNILWHHKEQQEHEEHYITVPTLKFTILVFFPASAKVLFTQLTMISSLAFSPWPRSSSTLRVYLGEGDLVRFPSWIHLFSDHDRFGGHSLGIFTTVSLSFYQVAHNTTWQFTTLCYWHRDNSLRHSMSRCPLKRMLREAC